MRLDPTNQPAALFSDTLGVLLGLPFGGDGLLPCPTHIGVAEFHVCGSCHAHPFWMVSA